MNLMQLMALLQRQGAQVVSFSFQRRFIADSWGNIESWQVSEMVWMG